MPDTMADVVLRSEARLARSLTGYPFTGALNAQQESDFSAEDIRKRYMIEDGENNV